MFCSHKVKRVFSSVRIEKHVMVVCNTHQPIFTWGFSVNNSEQKYGYRNAAKPPCFEIPPEDLRNWGLPGKGKGKLPAPPPLAAGKSVIHSTVEPQNPAHESRGEAVSTSPTVVLSSQNQKILRRIANVDLRASLKTLRDQAPGDSPVKSITHFERESSRSRLSYPETVD